MKNASWLWARRDSRRASSVQLRDGDARVKKFQQITFASARSFRVAVEEGKAAAARRAPANRNELCAEGAKGFLPRTHKNSTALYSGEAAPNVKRNAPEPSLRLEPHATLRNIFNKSNFARQSTKARDAGWSPRFERGGLFAQLPFHSKVFHFQLAHLAHSS